MALELQGARACGAGQAALKPSRLAAALRAHGLHASVTAPSCCRPPLCTAGDGTQWGSRQPYVVVEPPEAAAGVVPAPAAAWPRRGWPAAPGVATRRGAAAAACCQQQQQEQQLIVEVGLREAFCASPCSPSYAAHLRRLPEVFVGSRQQLLLLAAAAADALAANFRDSGRPLPPWRRRDAMLARWQKPAAAVPIDGMAVDGDGDDGSSAAPPWAAAHAQAAAYAAFGPLVAPPLAEGALAGDRPLADGAALSSDEAHVFSFGRNDSSSSTEDAAELQGESPTCMLRLPAGPPVAHSHHHHAKHGAMGDASPPAAAAAGAATLAVWCGRAAGAVEAVPPAGQAPAQPQPQPRRSSRNEPALVVHGFASS